MSNGTSIARKSSPPESVTDTCAKPPSSLTCVSSYSPVQPASTGELRTLLLRDFPASPSALPESKPEPTTSATCGPPLGTLFGTYSLAPFCLKTCADLFPADTLEPSSVTWPTWGMWADGELSAQPIVVPPIAGTVSGSWATPTAHIHKEGGYPAEWTRNTPTLTSEAFAGMPSGKWPTPSASDNRDRGNMATPAIHRRMEKGKQLMLSMVVGGPETRGMMLNPEWVEWLMGWPIGWSDLKPLATAKFQSWLHGHGRS